MQHTSHMMGASQPLDAAMLVGMGLAMSLGHCLGMCGPLVASIAASQRQRGIGTWGTVAAQLLHHAGRITSYATIGLVFATVGSTVMMAGGVGRGLQATLSLLVGAVMILIGLGLLGWLPTRRWIESGRLAGVVVSATARLRDSGRGSSWFFLGVANGFLPCGPVYAVATGTLVATPLTGAAAMVLFGLGTVPALVVFALGVGRLSPILQSRFNRVAALLVGLIGLQLIARGASALGWIDHLKFGQLVIW